MKKCFLCTLVLFFLTKSLIAEVVHPCPPIPYCCRGPGNYPTAPCHGTNCALTVAAMVVPIVIIAGIAGIILATSDANHSH